MKASGAVRGRTIAIDTPINLPEGQRVEVDIQSVAPESETLAREGKSNEPVLRLDMTKDEIDAIIATDPRFEGIRRLDRMRARLLKRWGEPLNLSTQFIREDRDR